jgi:chemotaxis protein motB
MAKKNVTYEIKMGAPEYMNTYGDMMTLLLCFFVLLFAMSNVDAKKFEALVVSFSGSLGVLDGGNTLQDKHSIEKGSIMDSSTQSKKESNQFEDAKEKMQQQLQEEARQKQENADFEKLKGQIENYLKENKLEKQVSVANEEEGLVLRFQDTILFDLGSASLKPASYTILKYIGGVLNTSNFKEKYITVEGHTDNMPISNSTFASNWELSGGRASNVVKYLVENQNIDPRRLSAAGYSEYHPVAKNDTDSGRAKNRRVDIVILRSKQTRNIK